MKIASLYQLKTKYVTREIGNELVLVPLSGNVSQMNERFTMNDTGRFLWDNLSEKTTVGHLVEEMTETFDVSSERAEVDILLFLRKLDKLSLFSK
jgi:Coenzyme PQQ synthesis protein D (PqqD)